jgi:hypothetical protein
VRIVGGTQRRALLNAISGSSRSAGTRVFPTIRTRSKARTAHGTAD